MGNRLYVGNLSFDTTETEIQDAFAAVGSVSDVKLVLDRDTGRSRGFAFVSMATDEEAQKAIAEMSDVIYAQEQRLAKLEGFARLVAPQLQGLGLELDPTLFQKPPHY